MTEKSVITPSPEHPANPTAEELASFVESEQFKEWFGDFKNDPEHASKIVDEEGRPQIVYVGAPSGIREFHGNARNRTGANQVGFYSTPSRHTARFYATTLRDFETDEQVPASVYGIFLNIRNPKHVQKGDGVNAMSIHERPTDCDGYINDRMGEIVCFDPDQILIVSEEPVPLRS